MCWGGGGRGETVGKGVYLRVDSPLKSRVYKVDKSVTDWGRLTRRHAPIKVA